MNLARPRLVATLAATGVTAALVLGSPMGADAAKMITGKDIKNNSISGKDIKNGSLRSADFAKGDLPATGPAGPAGPAGTPAPQSTTVAFTGSYTAQEGRYNALLTTTATIPGNSVVTGLEFTAGGLAACDQGYATAAADTTGYNGFAYLQAGDPVRRSLYAVATGPSAVPVTFDLRCYDQELPSTEVRAVVTYAPVNPNPATTYSGVTVSEGQPLFSRQSSSPERLAPAQR